MDRRATLEPLVTQDGGMTLHPEVMTPAQQALLHRIGPAATGSDFYLGGGTAAAIQLGHRRSVDLNWFRNEPIADPLRLADWLRRQGVDLDVSSVADGTLHAAADGVLVSFLEFRYPMLQPFIEWPEFSCRLASPEDLACMKLSAIAGRGAKKDFIDLYALNRTGLGLERMIDLYQMKFGVRDTGHVVMSLAYFDDADSEEMPEMLWDVDWKDIKETFEGWVADYTRRA